jgi:hypothetical protein
MRMFPAVVPGVLLSFAILGGCPTAFGQESANSPTAADRPTAVDNQTPVDGVQVADDQALVALVEKSCKLQERGEWTEYARLIDDSDLRRFQTRFTPLLRIPDKGAGLVALFDGGRDVKTVLAWSPDEFFARFMRGTLASVPAGQLPPETKRQVLGIVREGPAQAHAVVRVERNMVSLTTTRMEVCLTAPRGGRLEAGHARRTCRNGRHADAIDAETGTGRRSDARQLDSGRGRCPTRVSRRTDSDRFLNRQRRNPINPRQASRGRPESAASTPGAQATPGP